MICFGILVNTAAFTLDVPTTRLEDLLAELTTWQAATFFTKKQLQTLLGKLSFVTTCVKPGRISMARLLNSFASASGQLVTVTSFPLLCSCTYGGGLIFFLIFLAFLWSSPHSEISRPFKFSTDACLHGGSAVCHTDCISFVFPDCIAPSTLHIKALEIFYDHCCSQALGSSVTGSQICCRLR